MSDELTPEEEKKIIEQAAQFIVKHDLEEFAEIILEGTAPFGDVVGELGFMMTYPLAVTFLGRTGSSLVNLLGFNYKLNARRILDRVTELKKEKEELQRKIREEGRLKERRRFSLSRLFRRGSSN